MGWAWHEDLASPLNHSSACPVKPVEVFPEHTILFYSSLHAFMGDVFSL